VEAGGAWTSVTPGSQQYWLQAFNNVLYGRWKKIDPGFGKAVLGYFGRTPLPPDPEVIKAASEQLDLPVFDGDPLEAAPKNIAAAQEALKERNLPVNDKNTFLVLAAMVPGKKMDINEGIRLLTGKPKIDVPLKKKKEEKPAPAPAAAPAAGAAITGPVTSRCTVEENGSRRTFLVTVEPAGGTDAAVSAPGPAAATVTAPAATNGTPVFSTFAGSVEVVDVMVKIGDAVSKGQAVAAIEAMKARHEIKSPCDGKVSAVNVQIGDEIDSTKPILTIS
jgi:pyruvate carboxylase subunit B